jgi:hypothetical protein
MGQEFSTEAITNAMLLSGMLFILFSFFFIVLHIFFAFCLAGIAYKMGMPFSDNFILALIPIANLVLLLELSNKRRSWMIILLIPIINFFAFIILWMAISKRLGKPAWWGIVICLFPPIGLIFLILLLL